MESYKLSQKRDERNKRADKFRAGYPDRVGGEKNIFNLRFTAKTRCRKTNTYPRAGHDGLPELWETICQAQYRPSLSSSNPQKPKVHSRCQRSSHSCALSFLAMWPFYTNLYSAPLFPLSFSFSPLLSSRESVTISQMARLSSTPWTLLRLHKKRARDVQLKDDELSCTRNPHDKGKPRSH